jgi:hypothetical protein
MTSKEAYKKYLLKINKNDTNSNIKVSKGEFVLMFNEWMYQWVDEKFDKFLDSSDINELEYLLVKDIKLTQTGKDKNSVHFKFPKDLLKYASSYSEAEKGGCSSVLVNWNVKPRNVNVLLKDENNNPSFEYEETICTLEDGSLIVYVSDFTIKNQYLSYYKLPTAIDLEGYIKVDGSRSSNIDPMLSMPDLHIDQIINRCVIETTISYENAQATNLSASRLKLES